MTNERKENTNKLIRYLELYKIDLPYEVVDKVVQHTELVLEKNKTINLTAIKDIDKALILHSLDSLLFLKEMTLQEPLKGSKTKVLDLGTGGGYPGLPIACCGFSEVTLLDSVNKKVNCCKEFSEVLGLENSVICIHSRFEEYALNHKGEFDYVVARAVAPLDVLLEYAEPYVKTNGKVIFSKGNPSLSELSAASKVEKICGFKNVSRETLELPENFGHRELFTYIKTNKSKVKLPRRNGDARNKPLANL